MTLDNRHSIALPYWARPGVALFAKRADDNDGGDDDANDDDEDDDDEDDDPDADLSDEELRAELKKTRDRLAKASNQSAKRRKIIRERETELEAERSKRAGGGKPKGKGGDDDAEEIDVEAIRTAATAEGRKTALGTVKKVAIRAGLRAAGISDDKTLKRAVGMIDADELDVDDDGEVDGLDDAIATLRDEVPAIFGVTRRRRSAAGEDDRSGDGKPKPKDEDASKRQAASLLGK